MAWDGATTLTPTRQANLPAREAATPRVGAQPTQCTWSSSKRAALSRLANTPKQPQTRHTAANKAGSVHTLTLGKAPATARGCCTRRGAQHCCPPAALLTALRKKWVVVHAPSYLCCGSCCTLAWKNLCGGGRREGVPIHHGPHNEGVVCTHSSMRVSYICVHSVLRPAGHVATAGTAVRRILLM